MGTQVRGALGGARSVARKLPFGEKEVDGEQDKESERRAPIGQETPEQKMLGRDAEDGSQIEVEDQRARFGGEREDEERADDDEQLGPVAVAEIVPAPHCRAQEDEKK